MKYVKMLALAAVAAAALMAFVGANSASATVLCMNNLNTTTCGAPFGVNEEIHAVLKAGTKAKLVTSFKTIECEESTSKGTIGNAGGKEATVSGPIESLTWGKCNCEVVKTVKGGTLEIHWIAETDNGTLTSSGAEVETTCSTIFGKVHCVYVTSNTDLGTLDGGKPAVLTVKGSKIPVDAEHSNSLCPEKSEWNAEYEVTTPNPLYVSAG
jgi:hypothetical protein